ncbi:NAD(P)/FAD-dependent oxidoreductase, partial [Chloroflexota bacterium]
EGMVKEAREAGYKAGWFSGDEARRMDNTLSNEVRAAAINDVAQVEPFRYTLALAQASEKLGVTIKYARVIGFSHNKNRVNSVILDKGNEIKADKVVIAMGPWSSVALGWLGLKLPMATVRGQTLKLIAPKRPQFQLSGRLDRPREWPRVYLLISPRVDGTLLVGYTEDRTENWDDLKPESWMDYPSSEMTNIILEDTIRAVPVLSDAILVEERAGIIAYPPAEGMVIGEVPDWNNVYLATIGDNGIALSPEMGRIISNLIIGGEYAVKARDEIKSIEPMRFIKLS